MTPHAKGDCDLAQRFVDQELTPEDRVRCIGRLGHDDAFRRRVLALEQLALAATTVPRPVLSRDFVAGVLRRIESKPSVWRRVADAVWQPRPLRWNLVGATAAAVALLVAGGVVSRMVDRRETATTVVAGAAGTTPVLVRLVVLRPDARRVEVAGDFNGWNPAQTPLEQLANGAWTVTLPLEPGRYNYMFVVDGTTWVDDPFAPEQADDGFGSRNAVLDVRPPTGGVM